MRILRLFERFHLLRAVAMNVLRLPFPGSFCLTDGFATSAGRRIVLRRQGGQLNWTAAHYAEGQICGQLVYAATDVGFRRHNSARLNVWLEDNHPAGQATGSFAAGRFAGCYDAAGRPDGQWRHTVGLETDVELWSHGMLTDAYVECSPQGDRLPAVISLEHEVGLLIQEALSSLH